MLHCPGIVKTREPQGTLSWKLQYLRCKWIAGLSELLVILLMVWTRCVHLDGCRKWVKSDRERSIQPLPGQLCALQCGGGAGLTAELPARGALSAHWEGMGLDGLALLGLVGASPCVVCTEGLVFTACSLIALHFVFSLCEDHLLC